MINTEFKTWWANYWLSPFSWSRWTDIDTFYYDTHPYLLQGKVNKRSNAKKFKITAIKNTIGHSSMQGLNIEQLFKCGLIDQTVKYNDVKNF